MKAVITLMASTLLLAGCADPTLREASPQISTGTLAQAKYVVAAPAKWNGYLLMLAHGYRPADAPLSADFDVESRLCKGLLADGWIIASSSYRRNGRIIRDAVADIDALRRHVASEFGQPKRTFVIGPSMGGAIGAMIAETRAPDYDGVVAIGAALTMHDELNPYQLTHRPQMPVLFLTNQSELAKPTAYVERAAAAPDHPAVIWVVKRDGHCNVNFAETRAALDALVQCARTGRLESNNDATVSLLELPSVAIHKDGRAYATVTGISESFGNIYTQFVSADLQRLGITPGSYFVVGKGDKAFKVQLGKTYSDVPRGQWVAFIAAEGTLKIARNFENASKTLTCKPGDRIFIAKQQSQPR